MTAFLQGAVDAWNRRARPDCAEDLLRQAFRAGFARAIASHRDFVQNQPSEDEAVAAIRRSGPWWSERCGSCAHFRRGSWHAAHGGGEQCGGYCQALYVVLASDNAHLVWDGELYVHDTFGCSMWRALDIRTEAKQ